MNPDADAVDFFNFLIGGLIVGVMLHRVECHGCGHEAPRLIMYPLEGDYFCDQCVRYLANLWEIG